MPGGAEAAVVGDLVDRPAAAAQRGGAAVGRRVTEADDADDPPVSRCAERLEDVRVPLRGHAEEAGAPRPASTAVSSMSIAAMPVSTSQ